MVNLLERVTILNTAQINSAGKVKLLISEEKMTLNSKQIEIGSATVSTKKIE